MHLDRPQSGVPHQLRTKKNGFNLGSIVACDNLWSRGFAVFKNPISFYEAQNSDLNKPFLPFHPQPSLRESRI